MILFKYTKFFSLTWFRRNLFCEQHLLRNEGELGAEPGAIDTLVICDCDEVIVVAGWCGCDGNGAICNVITTKIVYDNLVDD